MTADAFVNIQVNGKGEMLREGTTVAGLLEKRKISPGAVVVEINLRIVDRKSYDCCKLVDGDKVEVISFMAGG